MSENGFTVAVLPTTEPKHLNGGPTATPYPSNLSATNGGSNNVSFVNISYTIKTRTFVQSRSKKILDNVRYVKTILIVTYI